MFQDIIYRFTILVYLFLHINLVTLQFGVFSHAINVISTISAGLYGVRIWPSRPFAVSLFCSFVFRSFVVSHRPFAVSHRSFIVLQFRCSVVSLFFSTSNLRDYETTKVRKSEILNSKTCSGSAR